MLPVDVHISVHILQLAFAISRATQLTGPEECPEIVEHYMCLLGAPPCDPISHQPLLICDRNCEAYNRLTLDRACNNTVDAVREFAISSNTEDILKLLQISETFDCGNASSYYFFEVDTQKNTNTCTNVLSMESEGEFKS